MRVLITGGTGTFGNAMAPYLLTRGHQVIIYSRDEQKQEAMSKRLEGFDVRFYLGDVRDRSRLELAMYGCDTVIHAAALKIVPKGEWDASEFVRTNIMGSDNVVHAAVEAGVGKVLLLSTDKAVQPINLYGATKLAAERLFLAAEAYRRDIGPIFAVVRYGNVMGSRGSVLASWRALPPEAPLPVTDPAMTRFWISPEEAVHFVWQAHEVMSGGEIFIPTMRAFSLGRLAYAFAPDRPITVVGVRPGEKLHEDLITHYESTRTVLHNAAYVIVPQGATPEVPLNWHTGLTSANCPGHMDTTELQERIHAL